MRTLSIFVVLAVTLAVCSAVSLDMRSDAAKDHRNNLNKPMPCSALNNKQKCGKGSCISTQVNLEQCKKQKNCQVIKTGGDHMLGVCADKSAGASGASGASGPTSGPASAHKTDTKGSQKTKSSGGKGNQPNKAASAPAPAPPPAQPSSEESSSGASQNSVAALPDDEVAESKAAVQPLPDDGNESGDEESPLPDNDDSATSGDSSTSDKGSDKGFRLARRPGQGGGNAGSNAAAQSQNSASNAVGGKDDSSANAGDDGALPDDGAGQSQSGGDGQSQDDSSTGSKFRLARRPGRNNGQSPDQNSNGGQDKQDDSSASADGDDSTDSSTSSGFRLAKRPGAQNGGDDSGNSTPAESPAESPAETAASKQDDGSAQSQDESKASLGCAQLNNKQTCGKDMDQRCMSTPTQVSMCKKKGCKVSQKEGFFKGVCTEP